ncbi:MAG TPA: hypothetical protein VN083_00100, partial [Vicinamibacteria bacterium]|nr:hypothetical protein [Vicinamibacteria bacterium]
RAEALTNTRTPNSAGFEARALRYRKTLVACQEWYDQQVSAHVDFTLAVLNRPDWEKFTDDPYPMPASYSWPPPMVILPARFEDFPNSAAFTDDVELLVENISCHEAGHIYTYKLEMDPDDTFLAELYANLFMVSFVRARRPDMLSFLQGPPANLKPQRYTSLEDLQYLAGDVGMTNYGWFQFQVYHLSDLLLKDKPLPALLRELKSAFRDPTARPFSDLAARLEAIHPGLGAEMGSLWKPTTLPDAHPDPCSEPARSGKDSVLVVQNSSAKAVALTRGKAPAQNVAANSWTSVSGHAGDHVHVDGGVCFVIGDEPAIAHIPAQ